MTTLSLLIRFLARFLPERTLLFLLRWLNRVNSRLPWLWLRQYVLRSQQPWLRSVLGTILSSLPPTGLYYAVPRVDEFRSFCLHILEVFLQSPRTRLLLKCNAQLVEMCASDTDVEWLVRDALKIPVHWRLDVVDVHDRLALLDGGKLYKTYTRHLDRAAEPDELPAELRQTIVAGMREKAASRRGGVPVTDQEAERRVGEIVRERMRQRSVAQEHVDELAPKLQTNAQYLTFARAHRVFDEHVKPLYDEYKAFDRAIGSERNSRGSSFETLARAAACDLVLDALGPAAIKTGAVERCDNVEWVAASDGRHTGEVDVCIVQRTAEERRVLALVELKSHCFEVACGFEQQRQKCVPDNKLKLASDVLIDGDASMPVFVTTTIPTHPFLLGAPPALLQRIAAHFTVEYEDVEGKRPRKQPADASDFELQMLAEDLQNEFGLSEASEPHRFLRETAERIFVVVV
jgi:hypothetical protein